MPASNRPRTCRELLNHERIRIQVTCFRRERHRMIVAMAHEQPWENHAPATSDHDADRPVRRVSNRRPQYLRRGCSLSLCQPSPRCRQLTQHHEHSLFQRRKSMSFTAPTNIKVIIFEPMLVADIGCRDRPRAFQGDIGIQGALLTDRRQRACRVRIAAALSFGRSIRPDSRPRMLHRHETTPHPTPAEPP